MKKFHLPSALSDIYGGYVLLNVFDLTLTVLILSVGGREANPFFAYFLHTYGPEAFIVCKMTLVAVTLVACELLRPLRTRTASAIIHMGFAVYFCLVLWECSLVFHHAPYLSAWIRR